MNKETQSGKLDRVQLYTGLYEGCPGPLSLFPRILSKVAFVFKEDIRGGLEDEHSSPGRP